jgi:hypothetical protein
MIKIAHYAEAFHEKHDLIFDTDARIPSVAGIIKARSSSAMEGRPSKNSQL